MPTSTIYLGLFVASCLYTVMLVLWRHLLEPDLTILEVIFSVTLCLSAPYLDARANGPLTWETYEWRVWSAFMVGCIPIAIWQVAKFIHARIRVEARIGRERTAYDDAPEGAAAMAEEPGTAPQADD